MKIPSSGDILVLFNVYEVTQIFFKSIFRYLTLFSVFVLVSYGVGHNPQSKSGAVVRSVPAHEESFFSRSSSIQTGKKWRLLKMNTTFIGFDEIEIFLETYTCK